jgi:PAS domain S-box-containing protein
VVSATLSLLCMTAILVVEPSLNAGRTPAPYGRPWLRPALLGLSMGGACVIVAVALLSPERRLSTSEGIVLAAVVFGAAGFRMLMNQLTTERTAARLAVALREREEAVASIRHAAENVSISEARLRLLLGAAVDGMVELDGLGTVVRANRAFCAMVRLPEKEVIGRRWTEMVERAGAGSSLADLPQTGEAVLVLPAGTLHLEARSSRLPGTPPGTLLLIRDVTANKTSEQTIRTLLHFLQDRDEDRTRLLSRSNAAIEAERNRIARDLHDGPIQGISATALSLEALRMMIEAGDPDRALGTLKEIAAEIGEEAVNLRRIMSDLRPPVLEERGLIPAVRELCSRVRRETGIIVELTGSPSTAASRDLETLAYRVVQEALSNVSKHSGAKHVMVRIAVGMGIVEVVVEDDGWGFDAGGAREFLRTGKVGLASMRERTELAGGSFSIRSTPGGGTVVTASIPFDPLASGSPMAELGDSLAGLPTGVEPKEESLAEYSSRMSDDDWDFRSRDSTRPRPREDDQSKVVVVPGTRGSDEAMGSARRPIAPESG